MEYPICLWARVYGNFYNSLFQKDFKRLRFSMADLENFIYFLNKHLFDQENKRKPNQQLEMKREDP